ncbi:MAG: PAS domain S-box protein [bacterium]
MYRMILQQKKFIGLPMDQDQCADKTDKTDKTDRTDKTDKTDKSGSAHARAGKSGSTQVKADKDGDGAAEGSAKITILNVDDNEAGRYATSRLLKKAGFAVKEAATGQQALLMAAVEQPDLIILDVHLPDMNGFEVCRRIKSDPATALIPVLHLSATYLDSQSRVEGLESGADSYLTQPVEPMVLIATIKALLRMRAAESQVTVAARQWQVTFDTISDGVCLLDQEGKIIQCNRFMLNLLGQPESEIVGRRCSELIECPCLDPEGACFKRLRESGQRESFDWQTGSRWFRISLDPVRDEAGRLAGAVQIMTDITAQKQAQEDRERLNELLEAERARFEEVLRQMPAGVIIAEAPSGRLVLANEQVEKIFRHPGLMSSDVEHYSEWKGFHPDAKPYQPHEWPLARSVREGEVIISEEIDILRGDGTHGTISVSAAPIRDVEGHIMAGVATFSDVTEARQVQKELRLYRHHLEELVKERTIELTAANAQLRREVTERRQAEARLRESESKYSTVVEQARDWVFIIQDGIFKFSNQAVYEISGYLVEEIMDKSFLNLVSPEFRDLVGQRYAQRMSGENPPSSYEVKVQHKDGATRDVEVSARVIQYQGKPADMCIVRDITGRKRLEEEMQKAQRLESIGVLAGGIAHDFNNILTSIIGNLSLATMLAKPGDRISKLLDGTEKSACRARDLTRQLLTFAKGGAPIKQTASISELLKDTTTFSLRGSKVKAEFSLAEDLWPVEVDTGQISQVVNNLVINAKQAMPEGGIIRVTAQNATIGHEENKVDIPLEEGRYIKISVEDQGAGIPDEHLQRIFDPYFTTKETGTGLGLATSYSIIKRHEGYITVKSQPGVGTTFFIYLPASKEKGKTASTVQEEEAGLLSGQGRILVMDDEQIVRDVARRMLEFIGYEVELARDGAEAIALYEKARKSGHPFDAIIMDITVPGGMGGEAAIRKLREVDPKVKAIVSSGYSSDALMADIKRSGFRGIIAKPYKVTELARVLQRVIKGK